MKSFRKIRSAPLVIVLASLVLWSVTNMGTVICVGDDGHVEIESVGASCCPTASLEDASEERGQGPDCGTCLDIELVQNVSLLPPLEKGSLSQVNATFTSIFLPVSIPMVSTMKVTPRSQSTVHSNRRSTTVLLI